MKYFAKLVTQTSFWYGLLVMLFCVFGTTGQVMLLALVMLFLDDKFITGLINKIAPGLTKWVQEVVDEL